MTSRMNDVKIIFNSFKIKHHFSYKDKIPTESKSNLVYKFTCQECNSCYIGETTRHLKTRIDEHCRTDRNSHIYRHLHQNINCYNNFSKQSFKIIDTAKNKFDLKIKEAIHINFDRPNLNAQVNHHALTLF